MPDRSHLYDGRDALFRIREEARHSVVRFLQAEKARLDGRGFVGRYWEACLANDRSAPLVDDIPWLPTHALGLPADCCSGDMAAPTVVEPNADDGGYGLISADRVTSGEVQIWRYAPECIETYALADSLAVKVMLQAKIHILDPQLTAGRLKLSPGHWLHKSTPSFEDLQLEVLPYEVKARAKYDGASDYQTVSMAIVDEIFVRVRSTSDSSYAKEVRIADDWVIVEDDAYDDSVSCAGRCVTVLTAGSSRTHPVDSLATYMDENDQFRDEWRDEAFERWNAIESTLRGGSMASMLQRTLFTSLQRPLAAHRESLALIRLREHPAGGLRWSALEVDERFLTQVAAAFDGTDASQPTAERLQQALIAVARPGSPMRA